MNFASVRSWAYGCLVICLLCGCGSGGPAEYPSKPITYLVPWSPGGMTDGTSRIMGVALQQVLDNSVSVINRTGGGGVVGHLALSQAKPDGYTLGAVTVEITMLKHMGLTDLGYQDYTPLALLINNPAGVTVRADAPWNTVAELVEAIRSNPGQYQASGTARGGIWDLARLGFLAAADLEGSALPWVPSQGASPALQELIAGGVDVVTASPSEVESLRKAGQVKLLAVMAEERLPNFPEIPTLKESGIDWSIGGWVSVCAPANLDPAAKVILEEAVKKATQDEMFISSLTQTGSNIQTLFGDELVAFMAEQDKVNGDLMKSAGIAQ